MKATSYDRRLQQKSYIIQARNNFSLNHQNFVKGKILIDSIQFGVF